MGLAHIRTEDVTSCYTTMAQYRSMLKVTSFRPTLGALWCHFSLSHTIFCNLMHATWLVQSQNAWLQDEQMLVLLSCVRRCFMPCSLAQKVLF